MYLSIMPDRFELQFIFGCTCFFHDVFIVFGKGINVIPQRIKSYMSSKVTFFDYIPFALSIVQDTTSIQHSFSHK